MILQSLSTIWTAIAAPLGNHLWQSTLIALAAGLLTLLLRKNHAQIRYLLWLAASLKFLLPFSLLVTLGVYLSKSHTSTASSAGLYVVIDQVSQPFAPSVSIISPAATSTLSSSLFRLLPVLLFVWLCGFAAVLLVWCIRWRRVAAATRSAAPLREGRELETLRRLQGIAPTLQDIDLRLSAAHLEPGIFGIVRSVLIWPQGISDLLGDEHLEAIIAHELWHVRRRDNLAAALHMLVEAFFWFHPLVWWIGARLLHERERACDESVLASGGNRHIYAESILKICEFCVTSPLPCISGVTGADLKRRISRIMTGPVARNLNLSRKLLLGAAASLAIALPIAIGLLNAGQNRASSPSQSAAILTGQSPLGRVGLVPDWQARAGSIPSFEIASLKQNLSGNEFSSVSFSINPGDVGAPTGGLLYGTNVPLISYIYFAYNLTGGQLQLLWPNLPHWFIDDKFDIQVQADGNPTNDQLRLVMQSVLAERFKLAAHYESRQLRVFVLVLAKPGETGTQLRPHTDDPPCASARPPAGSRLLPQEMVAGGFPADCGRIEALPSSPGRIQVGARAIPIELLAATLPQMHNFDRAVLDRTGLAGTYDFAFDWPVRQVSRANLHGEEPSPEFLKDLNEQLGLKLEPQTGPVEVLVIDHVERPAEPQSQKVAIKTPIFDVVSIKANQAATESLKSGVGVIRQRMMINPGELTATGNTLRELIRFSTESRTSRFQEGRIGSNPKFTMWKPRRIPLRWMG